MVTREVIVNNLKRKAVSSILRDVKVFLNTDDEDCKAPDIYSILKSAYHFLKDFENAVPNEQGLIEIDDVVSCINCCVKVALTCFSKENCSIEEALQLQFIQILYHIIHNFLKLGKYADSLQLSSDVQTVFMKDYKAKDNKENYSRFLGAIFWNEALKLEKKNALNNFETSFKLRRKAVDFTLIDNNLPSVKNYTYLTLVRYCYNNKESNSEDIICFLRNVWEHLCAVEESYSHLQYLFELLYSLYEFSVNYCKNVSVFNELVSMISKLYAQIEKTNGTTVQIKEVFKFCLEVSKFSIQIFFLRENIETTKTKKLVSNISKYEKFFKDKYFDLAPHTIAYFYLSLLKTFNSSESENIISLIKPHLNFCTTITQWFLRIFPKLKLQEGLPYSANSDIALVWSVLKGISLLIKNEKVEEKKIVIKEAKDFIESSLKKLKTTSRNPEFQTKLSSLGNAIGNIGFSSYNCGNYKESIYFLETGLKFAIFNEGDAEKSYKWKQILVYCYFLSDNHKMALQNVTSLMLHYKDKTKDCVELWCKVKRDALKNNYTAVIPCTVSDMIGEMKLKLSKEEEISLLVEELSGCKLERSWVEEEVVNIVKKLISLECSGINWAYALLVTITMGLFKSKKFSSLLNNTTLDVCKDMIQIFEDFVAENPANSERKIQLSVNYVWLYFLKLQHLHNLAKKEGAAYLQPKSDEESESDIQPTIPLLTILVEAETLKSLEAAVDIWSGVSRDGWSELSEAVKNWNLLTVIQAAGEFFALSANDVLELRTWTLLQTVATAVKNKEYELHSTIALMNLFVRMGYLDMALHLLENTDRSVFTGEEFNILKLKFYLAESNVHLHTGKFDDGLIILRKVLKDPTFEKSYKSVKMLQVQSMLLQSKFLMIPPSAFTDIKNLDYLSVNSAISSAMDCAGASKRLLKVLVEKETAEGCNDWMVLRTQLVNSLLSSYFLLAEQYMQIGDPRFARCFLLEGLKVAEENLLTYWSSKMLVLMGQVDLICKDINDCMVKLNCLKYIMDENSKENASTLLQKAFDNTEISELTDESEDYIIPIETRLNLPRAIKQNFINNSDVHSSPIPLKKETNSRFEIKFDPYSDHNIYLVYLIKLKIWALSCMQLIAEDKTELAKTQLKKLVQKCKLLKKCQNTKLLEVVNILNSSNCGKEDPTVVRKSSLSEKKLYVTALYNLSLLHFAKGESKLTQSYVDDAIKSLFEDSIHEKYLHSSSYGLLKYHQIVVSLKTLADLEPEVCLEFALCPSVKVKGLATNRILKDSSVLNVTPQKAVPKIQISPARKRIVKAPKKKDVIPAHIRKDMKKMGKSTEFPSLIFSSSDDEFFCKTPVPGTPKKASTKTNPSSSRKGLGNETNSYTLFKSTNSDLNIKTSSDIWKLSDFATPKANKAPKLNQTLMSERKTRQVSRNAKSENKSSKLLGAQAVKRSTRSRSNNKSELCVTKDSFVESSKGELGISEEPRVSIEHYRGTSRHLQVKSVLEDMDMEEDVFLPDISDTVSKPDMQQKTFKLPTGNHPSLLEKLCEDLTAMDITGDINGITKHKIPEKKLTEYINELDEIRLLVQHNAPYPLYVNLCKLLALLIMYKNADSSTLHDSAFLFSETFASILRQVYIGHNHLFKEKTDVENSQIQFSKLLKRKDTCIMEQMEYILDVIPPGFTVVQMTPLYEKEMDKLASKFNVKKLIVCRYQNNTQPLVMGLDSSSPEMSTSSIFADFSNILSESTLIMKNSDDKKKWWTTRSNLDERLKTLVKSIEDLWLGFWKGLLLSSPVNEKRKKSIKKAVNSLCKISEPSNKILVEVLLDSSSFLSKEQLSAAVSHLWNCKPHDDIFSQVLETINVAKAELPGSKRNPLVLILDKDLQALPWESLPILNDVPVSRMPSLNIMISKLSMPETKYALQEGLDSNNTYYILNPAGDLKYSQEYFQPIFEKQRNWEGIIGKPPTSEDCALALKKRDLFVYCGHGSGRQYLEGQAIDRMRCRASAILMGCSSGRLKQFEKQLEAYGIPLTYLMNGCPCVVGNLWDVTDKDIDRFTDKLFESFLPNYKEEQETTDVATAVSDARSACKMRYLVGSAPIIYGLPVFAKK